MGLSVIRIIFNNGLPSFPEIKQRFEKQTGLELQLIAKLNLNDISDDPNIILDQLNSDLESANRISSPTTFSKESIQEYIAKRDSFNHIRSIQFYTPEFYPISFNIQKNIIKIESEVGHYYFPTSLKKILLEAGGKVLNANDEIDQNWVIPAQWKALKHWDEYNWISRPRK